MISVKVRGDYIDGRFRRPPHPDRKIASIDPGDNGVHLATFGIYPQHPAEALQAAEKAFPRWRLVPFEERANYLRKFAAEVVNRRHYLVQLVALETGKAQWEAEAEVQAVESQTETDLREGVRPVSPFKVGEVRFGVEGSAWFEPLGPAVILAPAISPLLSPCSLILPALLSGCTVVFKPSKLTPATGQMIAEIFDHLQLPPGVFNLVQGDSGTGQQLAADPRVQVVVFAGSAASGQKILQTSAGHPYKKVILQAGGLNLAVILKDADLKQAVYECVKGAFVTTGQNYFSTCVILTERPISDDFCHMFTHLTKEIKIGYAFEPGVFMGPLLSQLFMQRFLDLQQTIGSDGAEPLCQAEALRLDRNGYYVSPAVWLQKKLLPLEKLRPQGLSFGPDVVIMPFAGEQQALAAAAENSHPLAASIFSRDPQLLQRWSEQLPYGIINHNLATTEISNRLPLEGPLGCGNRRPLGVLAQTNFTRPVAGLRATVPFDPSRLPPCFPRIG